MTGISTSANRNFMGLTQYAILLTIQSRKQITPPQIVDILKALQLNITKEHVSTSLNAMAQSDWVTSETVYTKKPGRPAYAYTITGKGAKQLLDMQSSIERIHTVLKPPPPSA